MEIQTEKFGIIHAIATCRVCNWDYGLKIDKPNRMQDVRNNIYKHVRETGHKVVLETGNTTYYSVTH